MNICPIVSVCMITYNHEPYITEAIEGVLMQQTTFPIELIISEDCSTDNTRKKIKEYADKYPDIIVADLPEKNRGMMKNFHHCMSQAQGKYIALCEGDDYWTDPLKLQKQVDFLEANPEYGLCYADYDTVDIESRIIHNTAHHKHKAMCHTGDLFGKILNINFMQTLTVCFRKDFLDTTIIAKPFSIDLLLFGSIAAVTQCYYMNDIVGAYRINPNGAIKSKDNKISNNLRQSSRFLIESYFNGLFPRRTGFSHIKILFNSVDSLFRYRAYDNNIGYLFSHPFMIIMLPFVLIYKLLRQSQNYYN